MAVEVQPQMYPTAQMADHTVRGRSRSRPMVRVQPQMRPTVQMADHTVRGRSRSRPMVRVQPQMRPTVQVADHTVRGRSRSHPMVTESAVVRMGGGNRIATLRFHLDEAGTVCGDVLSHSIAIGGDVAGGIAAGLTHIVVPGG